MKKLSKVSSFHLLAQLRSSRDLYNLQIKLIINVPLQYKELIEFITCQL